MSSASVAIAAIFAALSTLTPRVARIAIVRIPVPLAVSPPMSAITITADASAAATPITSPAAIAPASEANAPARPAIPANHPITIATGMNANNAGDTSSPRTLFDTMPVMTPAHGPARTATRMVPTESRYTGSLSAPTTAPSARLSATARGISASASVGSVRLAGRGTGG